MVFAAYAKDKFAAVGQCNKALTNSST